MRWRVMHIGGSNIIVCASLMYPLSVLRANLGLQICLRSWRSNTSLASLKVSRI